jgi:hypothetical protein
LTDWIENKEQQDNKEDKLNRFHFILRQGTPTWPAAANTPSPIYLVMKRYLLGALFFVGAASSRDDCSPNRGETPLPQIHLCVFSQLDGTPRHV